MSEARQPYGALLVTLGAALAALAALLLVLMLRVLIGPFSVGSALEGESIAPLRIGIWEPDSLVLRSGLHAPDRERLVRLWEEMLPAGGRLERLRALPARGGRGPDVVVPADLRWLDDSEAAALEAFVTDGGAVVTAGWMGVRANEDWAAGERRMARLLGVPGVARNPRESGYFVAAGRRGPLMAGLDPGRRAALGVRPELPGLDPRDAELYWCDWALRPSTEASGAALRRELGSGRLVWLAPTPDSTQADRTGREVLRAVVDNAIEWAARRPLGELLAWPDGARFAGLVAMDTEHGFENALGVAEVAGRHRLPITFLAVSSIALAHPEVTARLAKVGELGSHADVHEGFKDLSLSVQRGRLARSRRELESLGVPAPRGFRPPYESYDAVTRRALVETSFSYLLGDLEAESMAPRLFTPDGPTRTLVQLPRSAADDHELVVKRGESALTSMRAVMQGDLDRIARSGGLYFFSLHSQHFGTQDRRELIGWLADELRRRGAWRATAGELSDWWTRRAGVSVAFARLGPRRVEVRLTYHGRDPLARAAVRIHFNAPVRQVEVTSAKLFRQLPVLRFEPGADHADLRLPELTPDQSYAWSLDYALSSD